MKVLTTTLLTLVLVGFAGGSYGQDIRTKLDALDASIGRLAGGSYGQDIRTITYSNGDVYVGEFKDNQRSGQGMSNSIQNFPPVSVQNFPV